MSAHEFYHYDDEWVWVNGKQYSFSDFRKLFPKYSVPYGFGLRVYKRGEVHYISDGSNTLRLPSVDPLCDSICERQGELERLVLFLQNEDE